jgi:hypothetical protein
LLDDGDVSVVFQFAAGQTFSNWLGASRLLAAVSRTIKTSFCEGLHGALSAGDSVKVIPVVPVFDVDAVTTPEP